MMVLALPAVWSGCAEAPTQSSGEVQSIAQPAQPKLAGPADAHTATTFHNLGVVYKKQKRYAEAEPLYRRALAIWEKTASEQHEQIRVLKNLAAVYRAQGPWADGEALYKRFLANRGKTLGPDHPDLLQALESLAGLYREQGKMAEAVQVQQRVVQIKARGRGGDSH